MTTLNSARFVREAVESILRQSFTEFELIIVDGGSNDSTGDIVQSFGDARIRFKVEDGLRRSAQLNTAIRMAEGSLIAIMDSDDAALPDRLAEQVLFLKSHPEIGIVGTWAALMDKMGREYGTLHRPADHEQILQHLLAMNGICFGTAMFRRGVFERAGEFSKELTVSEDIDWLLRCAQTEQFANLPLELMKLRQHSASRSRSARTSNDAVLKSLQNTLTRSCGSDANIRRRTDTEFNLGLVHYYYGNVRDSRMQFLRALRQKPLDFFVMRYLAASLLPDFLLNRLRQSRTARSAAMWFRSLFIRREANVGRTKL